MGLLYNLMEKSRLMKHEQFMYFCNPSEEDFILDVGVQNNSYKDSDNYLESHYPYPFNITGLGIEDLHDFSKRYPEVNVVTYDGKVFPFEDNSFDYVWSNAVIEHVGSKERQLLFLSEMIRVAKKKIVFTTPNRAFPLEIHTRFPFVHWFSKRISDWVYIKIGKKWASGEYMYLLYKSDLVSLLNAMLDKYRISYEVIPNRMMGLTATFTVLITKK